MIKYSKQTVINYINGDDIFEYDIDELEKDLNFMIDVIKYTNDKNIYNICDDSLKKNFFFVRFLIEKFHDDLDFIIKVAKEYFDNNLEPEDASTKNEINILIDKYTRNNKDERLLEFKIKAILFYNLNRQVYNHLISLEPLQEDKDLLGFGFCITQSDYCGSDIIQYYFAENMLKEIFQADGFDLERMLHNRFTDKTVLLRYGINRFLIDYISKFDYFLSDYVCVHIEIIDELNKMVRKCIDRWEQYESLLEKEKILVILDEIEKFCYDNQTKFPIFLEVIKYVATEFNLKELFKKYDCTFSSYSEIYDEIDEITLEKIGFDVYVKLLKFKDVISKIYYDGVYPDSYIEDAGIKEINGKILKFNLNRRGKSKHSNM